MSTRGVVGDGWEPGQEDSGSPCVVTVERSDEDEINVTFDWVNTVLKANVYLTVDDAKRFDKHLSAAVYEKWPKDD